MMKKTILFLACLFNLAFFKSYSAEPQPWWKKQHPLLEAKVGYFFFTDSEMNDVLNEGGLDLQLSGSYPLYKILNVYASIEYLEKSGQSTGTHQRTSIWEIPVSLGLKPIFPLTDFMQYYVTLGPRYFFVQVHNNSVDVPKKMNANGCGGFVNTGFNFIVDTHFLIDIFAEYSFKNLKFHSHQQGTEGLNVQVGGLTIGGGIGYAF